MKSYHGMQAAICAQPTRPEGLQSACYWKALPKNFRALSRGLPLTTPGAGIVVMFTGWLHAFASFLSLCLHILTHHTFAVTG